MYRAPDHAHAVARPVLETLDAQLREQFELRLDRWWSDLEDGLRAVYPPAAQGELIARLVRLAASAFAARDPDLRRLDTARTLDPDWFQSEAMLGYAAYCDRFTGDLAGISSRLDYLEELGVSYLHLMPLLRPREGDSDGGYAVADYRSVRPDLGTIDDLKTLAARLRERDISLVLDLVLNHVAREHPWAQAARAGDEYYRAFFRIFPDRSDPDAYERTLPEVFPDFAPGSFSWDDELGAWVWTTFNAFQWDLDWSNPDVFHAFAEIILFLAGLGVQVLRLDAIAFIWKRLGTNCQNQPEVHAITQALRAVARIAAPAVAFKAEAIVAPSDLVQYLGQGAHHGKVSDLAYHNSLMVQIWSMLAARDVRLAAHALRQLPPIPATTAWITYVRCHDDIGWAIADNDADAVGLDGFAHRAFLSDYYSGRFPGSSADGLVFQSNPATGDRRISGMTASLAGLERATDPESVHRAIGRMLLAYAVVLGWGGVPVIWMGDEIAMPNDREWDAEVAHAGDNRWTHRPMMDWDRAESRHDRSTPAGQMFTGLTELVAARRRLPQLDASVPTEILPVQDPGVLPLLRRHPLGELLELINVTDSWRPWPGERLAEHGLAAATDAITGRRIEITADGQLWLPPYAVRWLIA
ncbi:MAG: alpha-amylase family protein [Actinobacteria bacterium]|nr:alpha-amylase family protein [Actinomycetota bacterium]